MPTKYVFVTGGVVSGLGKGITAASLGRLLKAQQNSLELIIPSQRNGNGSFQVSFPLW